MSGRGCVCFVGNLPGDVREREIEDLFYKYGRIRNIDLKVPPRPPAFAFVEFENARDAEEAAKGRDGYDFNGSSLRVELKRGAGPGAGRRGDAEDAVRGRDGYDFGGSRMRVEISRGSMGGGYGGGGYGGGGGGGSSGGFGGRPPPPVAPPNFRSKGSAYRVLVKGLPMSASWQDLKDHFRKVCQPNYVNVYRDRGGVMGVVEFDTADDLDRAVRKLDDTEFRNPFERAYIRVYDDSDSSRIRARDRLRSRSRGRSASSDSRSRSRSRSRSSSRSRSRSRSRSASRSASRSRSASESRSRSPEDKPDKAKNGAGDAPADDAPAADDEAPAPNGVDVEEVKDDKAADED